MSEFALGKVDLGKNYEMTKDFVSFIGKNLNSEDNCFLLWVNSLGENFFKKIHNCANSFVIEDKILSINEEDIDFVFLIMTVTSLEECVEIDDIDENDILDNMIIIKNIIMYESLRRSGFVNFLKGKRLKDVDVSLSSLGSTFIGGDLILKNIVNKIVED